jgi:glucose uptake protein GlcU
MKKPQSKGPHWIRRAGWGFVVFGVALLGIQLSGVAGPTTLSDILQLLNMPLFGGMFLNQAHRPRVAVIFMVAALAVIGIRLVLRFNV